MRMAMNDPRAITCSEDEAGEILGFTKKTMQKRRWEGKPPVYLKVGRKVRYRLSDILAFLDECKVAHINNG